MDQLKDTLSNISLYDVKAYVRKAQNVVMNYTEMEAKVREATNNEPWGASSTLMQEIADGTNSYAHFHEIMPMIYKRFTEKSAEEWRQIYKALQLLEFLVKHGSERVVDYARSHSSVIDMLKHFHYTDQNGKDQGINIRNRAKELTILLADVEKIRSERKKARTNKEKYTGMGSGGFGGTGSKYGGFGSDSVEYGGGYEGRVFGDGGGFDGSNYSGPGYSRDDDYEEYEVEGVAAAAASSSSSSKAKTDTAPVKDIISFDDDEDEFGAPQTAATSVNKAAVENDDDEFDDFQSASTNVSPSAPATSNSLNSQITDLFNTPSPAPPTPGSTRQFPGGLSFSQQQAPPLTTPANALSNTLAFKTSVSTPGSSMISNASSASLASSTTNLSNQPPKKKDDAFSSLWSNASSKSKKPAKIDNSKVSLQSLAQQNVQGSMWGAPAAQPSSSNTQNNGSSNNDDLLSF